MPKIFKALASISVWVLFIVGLFSLIFTVIDQFTRSGGLSGGEPYNFNDVAWELKAIVTLFLSVVAMKIRKALE
ncbi:MAG: hypothetical protein HY528_00825 [Chloroflexi bacterium]|nr:hypothetical protein [Chloroflexota bacterium]